MRRRAKFSYPIDYLNFSRWKCWIRSTRFTSFLRPPPIYLIPPVYPIAAAADAGSLCTFLFSRNIIYTDTVDPYRLWIASYIAAVPSDRTRSTNIYNRSFPPPYVSNITFSPPFLFVTVVGCFPAVFLYCRCNIWQILSDVIFLSSWYSHHIISKGRFSRLTRHVHIEHTNVRLGLYLSETVQCHQLLCSIVR